MIAVAGVIIGAVIVGIAWVATVPRAKDGAGADAAAACQILDRVPDVATDAAAFDLAYSYRVDAASQLAAAAAEDDPRYRPLAAAAKQAEQAVVFNARIKAEELVRTARREC